MSWCRREKTLSSSVVNVSKGISTLVRISELHEGFSNWKKLRYDSIKKDQLYLKIFTIACRNNEWNLNVWWEDNSLRFSPRCRNRIVYLCFELSLLLFLTILCWIRCYLPFTSLVGITGSHNEDEPIFMQPVRKNRKFQFACLCLDSTIPYLNPAPRYLVLKIVLQC